MVRVSVIVVNWNGHEYLKACLDSLVSQNVGSYEIIVVDNGSSDGSKHILDAYPDVHVIKLPRNMGFARANNIGMAESDAEAFVLMNVDAVAGKGWLKGMYSVYERRKGMVAATIFTPQGELESRGLLMAGDGSTVLNRSEDNPIGPSGAAALYPAEMIEETGGFDEMYFSYAEDMDLAARGLLAGYRCLVSRASVMHHHSALSAGRAIYRGYGKRYLLERNRYFLIGKFFRRVTALKWVWHLLGKEMLSVMGDLYNGHIDEYLAARAAAAVRWDNLRESHSSLMEKYGLERFIALEKRLVRPTPLGEMVTRHTDI